ncbi:MAG: hypothetical protein M3R13_03730 [Armatimonadota bacterium]|nr:hypothetical protein [Armatimonadota bacterium]
MAPRDPSAINRNFKPSPPVRADQGPAFSARTGNRATTNFNGNNGNGRLGPELRPGNTIIPHFTDGKGGSFSPRVSDKFQDKLRWGYYNRDSRWRDRHFGYGYYCYQPIAWQCGFSPYYWYWSVPGYLPWGRCYVLRPTIIIIIGGFINWNYCGIGSSGSFYNTSYNNYSPLDRSLSDLKDAFIYRDYRSLDRLVSNGGRVEIFIDGEYVYSLDSGDYYDITADLIYSVETTDFDVVDVRRLQGNRGYLATARHEFIDSWGERQETYLTFTLQPGDGGYVITQAGTQRQRPY